MKIYSKGSENVYNKELKYRSEAKLINIVLYCKSSEANKVIAKIKVAKRSEHVYVKELKNQSEAKVVNIKL